MQKSALPPQDVDSSVIVWLLHGRLEQRCCDEKQSEPKAKAQENFTDSDSGIMKTAQGDFQQCYNSQIAVDADNHPIVANDVTQGSTDYQCLSPMVEEGGRGWKRMEEDGGGWRR